MGYQRRVHGDIQQANMLQKTLLLCALAVAYATATPLLSTGKNIVELAIATPELSTLVTALKAGALVDTLSGEGPFTVFAPTNEAFAKLSASILAHLLEPANVKELDAVLEYHVVSGAAVRSQFPFPATFCLQKKVRKKQNMCAAMFVCLFCRTVSSYTRNNSSDRSGLKFDPILPKKFGGRAGTV